MRHNLGKMPVDLKKIKLFHKYLDQFNSLKKITITLNQKINKFSYID